MSDSYIASRAGTAVKRRKPPQRPRRSCPNLLPELLIMAAALLYYAAASQARSMVLVGLFGLGALLGARNAFTWWRWRAWSSWTGEPIERSGKIILIGDWICALYLWVTIILTLT